VQNFGRREKNTVDCNYFVAELSLSPSKSDTKRVSQLCGQGRVEFCLLRAHGAGVPCGFRSKESMPDERLIGINSQGVRFSCEITVTDFICSGAKFHSF
jgi:hypothetical protein